MVERPCTNTDIIARIVALEASFAGFQQLMNERETRYTQRPVAQDAAVAAALETSKAAVLKAGTATEKRLEGLNELKGMAENQARTFARAEEVKLVQFATDKRMDDLSRMVAQGSARGAGMKELGAVLFGGVGLLIAGIALFLHH